MKRGKLVLVGALVLAAIVAGITRTTTSSAAKESAYKAAWIYVGPHNDAGWSQAHDKGRLYVQKKLGSNVQTTYKENIANGPQLQQTVASLVREGYKMIFGTSFGFFDKKLAAKYPNVLFEQATGTDRPRTCPSTSAPAEDTIYLSGMAAGAATKNGKIGYVVAVPDPRGDPPRERVRARRAGDASGREGQAHLDERVVRPGQGEEGGGEPRTRAGADVLGQNVDSPRPASTPSRRGSRGSATTRTRRSSRRSRG